MPILINNVLDRLQNEPHHRGWFVGHFLKENTPLKNPHVEIKWIQRKKGIVKRNEQYPQSAHSLIILISGKFQFTFHQSQQTHTLSRQGDYLYYDASEDSHESLPLEDTVAIEIRWPSKPREAKIV